MPGVERGTGSEVVEGQKDTRGARGEDGRRRGRRSFSLRVELSDLREVDGMKRSLFSSINCNKKLITEIVVPQTKDGRPINEREFDGFTYEVKDHENFT